MTLQAGALIHDGLALLMFALVGATYGLTRRGTLDAERPHTRPGDEADPGRVVDSDPDP